MCTNARFLFQPIEAGAHGLLIEAIRGIYGPTLKFAFCRSLRASLIALGGSFTSRPGVEKSVRLRAVIFFQPVVVQAWFIGHTVEKSIEFLIGPAIFVYVTKAIPGVPVVSVKKRFGVKAILKFTLGSSISRCFGNRTLESGGNFTICQMQNMEMGTRSFLLIIAKLIALDNIKCIDYRVYQEPITMGS